MLFTQSPIEASIWTAFVALQQWIVDQVILTSVFKGAVVTWLGYVLVRGFYRMATSGSPGTAVGQIMTALFFSTIGFAILRGKATEDFRPSDASGKAWTSSPKVRASGKFQALEGGAHGLKVYVQIHRGAAQLAAYISEQVARVFKNHSHSQSPFLFLQTMAKTAGATIDDPNILSSLNWLFDNCSNRREAVVLNAETSYASLFDMANPNCRGRYQDLRRDLHHWARLKWGTSAWNVGDIALSQVGEKLGLIDQETLQNKMIASALVNMARKQMGQNARGVHTGILLGDPKSDPLIGNGASFFSSIANLTSPSGISGHFFGDIFGMDFLAADARNKSAALYNRIVQFIPPIRGYAKGLLALAFVFATAGLCFGTPRFFVAWLGMLAMFTVYEPLSTILYETTMLFTKAQETSESLAALKNDPLVLSGAAIIDDNIARIEAVYFTLQLGLATICGAGGISLFVFSKQIGGGLSDVIMSKAVSLVRPVVIARSGGPTSGAH
jgi:hypothetical protein